ncbi:hypothetical protein [Actinoallomurus iriomotensis]|uniref:hypothetical protein n=1 Tax=Actinoallomurus iriomotensis TaxID=478107 RepID=UPI003D7F817F
MTACARSRYGAWRLEELPGSGTPSSGAGHLPGPGDTCLSAAQVARCGPRPGDHAEGAARSPRPGNRREKLRSLDTVNRRPANNPENAGKGPHSPT